MSTGRHEETREARCGASLAEPDDGHAAVAEVLAPDLRVEEEAHARLPMNPSWVPYVPSGSRPRYDHRSAPPESVQTLDISMRVTPAERSCAVFAAQRSITIRSPALRRLPSPIRSLTTVARSMSMT